MVQTFELQKGSTLQYVFCFDGSKYKGSDSTFENQLNIQIQF